MPRKKTAPNTTRSPEELELVKRYPHLRIVPASWRPAGGRAETHGKKRTVLVKCDCGQETVRATSDLFQVTNLCPQCKKTAKKK